MSVRRIKVIFGDAEMILEAEEDFLIMFLNSKCMSMSESTIVKSKKSSKLKPIGSRGAKTAGVLEAIKLGKSDGISIDDIAEATKLSKTQLASILSVLKKKGLIKSVDKGVYAYVKPKKENTKQKENADPATPKAITAS
ncbi:MAG: winged helix-turn-helix domain-containing protein [Syntrophus sp. (in: bacteria)]